MLDDIIQQLRRLRQRLEASADPETLLAIDRELQRLQRYLEWLQQVEEDRDGKRYP